MNADNEKVNTHILNKLFNKKWFILSIIFFIAVVITVVVFIISKKDATTQEVTQVSEKTEVVESDTVKKGKVLSHNNCSGEGSVTLGTSPMKEEDFAFLIPYGLVVGAHVTPIDHQYFSPADFNSPRDTYDVVAMADGKIVEIQERLKPEGTSEYRIVFMHTCTFFTYYDLVTSLASDIEEEFEKSKSNNYAALDIDVKEGQLIGKIGGQTLDFAVWNTELTLDGFVVPEHYESEAWKIHTADPYDYYTDELKDLLTRKNLRVAEPIAGKIDYDVDGRLVGNWFVEGTGGYGSGGSYWETHLSIAPEHLDPTATIISIGDFNGEAKQFIISREASDPENVRVDSGLVMYDLFDMEYLKSDGGHWDRMTLVQGISAEATEQNNGCILFELMDDRRLKVEVFSGRVCSSSLEFTSGYKLYER